MKKSAITITLALGIMVLSFSNVQAINPSQLSAEVLMIQSDVTIENEIIVEDWMFSFDAQQMASEKVMEKNISLESWMIDASWNVNTDLIVSESNIELEDWMTESFTPKNNRILARRVPLM